MGMSLVFACMAPHGARPPRRPACSAIRFKHAHHSHSREQHDTDGTDDNQSVLLLIILEAKEYSTTFVVLVLL